MTCFILIIFLALFGFICYKNYKLGLALFVFLLPSYIIRFQFGQIPTTLLELCFLIIFVFWAFKINEIKYLKYLLKKPHWLIPMLVFLTAATIGVFVSPDIVSALGVWKAYFIEPLLFFFILCTTLKTKDDWFYVLNGLIFSGLAIAFVALFQKPTGFFIPEAWQEERRVTSIFGYPNAVGLYLGPIIVIALAFCYRAFKIKNLPSVLLYFLMLLIMALAINWSKTEAAWIAVAAAVFIFCMFKKELRIPTIVLAVIIVLTIGLIPVFRDTAVQKITLQDWSGQVRKTTWLESWNMLKANPIFGAGLSGYPIKMVEFHKADYLEIFQYPHNVILNFWSELGILGTLAWLWLVAVVGRIAWIKRKLFLFAPTLIAVFAVFLIHGLVDVPYLKNDLAMMFWLFMGLAFWLERPVNENNTE